MGTFPFTKEDREAGERLIASGSLKDIFFSEGTYQVLVMDGEEFWPFFQITDEGVLSDSFCTCEKAENSQSCPHLAAGFLQINRNEEAPIHVRFRATIWNHLFSIAACRHGYDSNVLKNIESFSITPKNEEAKKKLHEIIHERVEETEETSLKFSNLAPEEMERWRSGNPSDLLLYELSPFADLAKYCMFLQETEGDFRIDYLPEDRDRLPTDIVAEFDAIQMQFAIEKEDWDDLIPSLASIESPMEFHEFSNLTVQKITYDRDERILHVQALEAEGKGIDVAKEDISVGNYFYSKQHGFFPGKTDPILRKRHISGHDLGILLNKYPRYIARFLHGDRIYLGEHILSYDLYFDQEGNLHIASYLFSKGDLNLPQSADYGKWVYVQDRGFYRIHQPDFQELHKVVLREEVGEFISRHRLWLGKFDGFQTHIASIDSYLQFNVAEDGLRFETTSDILEDTSGFLNLGEWIYIKGRGFYSRGSTRANVILRPGLVVPNIEVSDFIDKSRDDLEQISGFFSSGQPLANAGLEVNLTDKGHITISPFYEFHIPYKRERVRIYKNYIYVEGEGFSPVPSDYRLPENYSKEVQIDKRGESAFLHYELPAIMPFVYRIDPRLRPPEQLRLKVSKIRKATKGKWLIEFEYESEFGSVPVNALWEGIQKRKIYIISRAGLIYFNQSRFNWLKGIPGESFIEGKDQIELTTLDWIRLNILERIKEPTDDPESIDYLRQINSLESADLLSIKGLKSNLRPYQDKGLRWLWFLYCHGLSGLLCDEMGLGKTHQAMALLAATINQNLPAKKKFLIVCPTSVIYHWENLLQRFLPKVKVRLFYGLSRTLRGFARGKEVLLTSYGTLRSEQKALAEFDYEVVIFDEIQVAKNAFSQTHKALRLLKAHMKLGLTGTPIENRLFELKSLFDIILPGYFPGDAVYKELFVTPIEKRGDDEKRGLLSSLIKPFVLRRKKDEVLQDLPEKIEEISICELSSEQRDLYRQAFQAQRDTLFAAITDKSTSIPYVHIFSLFNKLKQICNHPALSEKSVVNFANHHSGKWELFVELLHEARESGQKVVVFSQYLGMLDIIKAHLKTLGVGFAEIRGSTKNRREQMEKFKEDPKCEVFIGSLQAAGVGIDLVTASVVIHYDRWWNPAKENQATDRVHRIGQNRGVQVFKLVTKDTIEEHIHALIERKKGLLENIVGFDDQDQIKSLDRSELAEILNKIQADLS
jgi:superfamily II DNA or RNA helicase